MRVGEFKSHVQLKKKKLKQVSEIAKLIKGLQTQMRVKFRPTLKSNGWVEGEGASEYKPKLRSLMHGSGRQADRKPKLEHSSFINELKLDWNLAH